MNQHNLLQKLHHTILVECSVTLELSVNLMMKQHKKNISSVSSAVCKLLPCYDQGWRVVVSKLNRVLDTCCHHLRQFSFYARSHSIRTHGSSGDENSHALCDRTNVKASENNDYINHNTKPYLSLLNAAKYSGTKQYCSFETSKPQPSRVSVSHKNVYRNVFCAIQVTPPRQLLRCQCLLCASIKLCVFLYNDYKT